MISKNGIKFIKSLEQKKVRKREQLFVAEGPKVVDDLIKTVTPTCILALAKWYQSRQIIPRQEDAIVTEEELQKISFLQHPQQVLAVFPIPTCPANDDFSNGLFLALDDVQDPGNLGTIIRIADWFGIKTIICSHGTADAFNPKVIQATMGSIARVKLFYTKLPTFFEHIPHTTPIYGTFLNGNNIYSEPLDPNGIIIMGNEGNGISPEIERFVNKRLLIPNFSFGTTKADSLNVAIATAITCSEFRRR